MKTQPASSMRPLNLIKSRLTKLSNPDSFCEDTQPLLGLVNASFKNHTQSTDKTALSGTYGDFKDNHSLKVTLFMCLIVSAMLALFVLLAWQITPSSVLANPQHQTTLLLNVIHITGVIINIACLPVYCLWLNRCCKNGWLLNPPKMKVTPGWAVAYYFIPIVSLWKPYANMLEIRNASFGMRSDLNNLIPIWWLSCLALIALTVAQLAGNLASNPEIVAISNKLSIVTALANITVNYLSITVILSITNAQDKRATELQR